MALQGRLREYEGSPESVQGINGSQWLLRFSERPIHQKLGAVNLAPLTDEFQGMAQNWAYNYIVSMNVNHNFRITVNRESAG